MNSSAPMPPPTDSMSHSCRSSPRGWKPEASIRCSIECSETTSMPCRSTHHRGRPTSVAVPASPHVPSHAVALVMWVVHQSPFDPMALDERMRGHCRIGRRCWRSHDQSSQGRPPDTISRSPFTQHAARCRNTPADLRSITLDDRPLLICALHNDCKAVGLSTGRTHRHRLPA
jgi:hypothetical protein